MKTLVGGPRVPVTVRTLTVRSLAANALARGGSIECDASRVRERAVNWLALALLLAAWNLEARLDDAPPASAPSEPPLDRIEPEVAGFDWTEPESTAWSFCAARTSAPYGAETPGSRVPCAGAVRISRSR